MTPRLGSPCFLLAAALALGAGCDDPKGYYDPFEGEEAPPRDPPERDRAEQPPELDSEPALEGAPTTPGPPTSKGRAPDLPPVSSEPSPRPGDVERGEAGAPREGTAEVDTQGPALGEPPAMPGDPDIGPEGELRGDPDIGPPGAPAYGDPHGAAPIPVEFPPGGHQLVLEQATLQGGGWRTFEVTNQAAEPHQLAIRSAEGVEVGPPVEIPPGETRLISIQLHPGEYTLACAAEGHAQQGEQASLTVAE